MAASLDELLIAMAQSRNRSATQRVNPANPLKLPRLLPHDRPAISPARVPPSVSGGFFIAAPKRRRGIMVEIPDLLRSFG